MDRFKYEKEMVDWHMNALKEHGLTEKALGWGSRDGMTARFEAACDVLKPLGRTLKGMSVLDVGCGYGDLLPFLETQDITMYNGIDLIPEFVQEAVNRNKGSMKAVAFHVKDVFEFGTRAEGFRDVVFALGVAWRANGKDYLRELMKQCFSICSAAVVISVGCDTTLGEKDGSNLVTPMELVEYSRGIADRFIVRHDFWPNDLMVYLYKEMWRRW